MDGVITGVAGTTLPAWTFTTGQMVISGVDQIFSNIDISSQCTTAGGAISTTATNIVFYGCRIQNTAANAASNVIKLGAVTFCRMIRCYLKATTTATSCVNNTTTDVVFSGCTIIGGITGLISSGVRSIVHRCVFDSQVTDGISQSTQSLYVIESSFNAGSANGNGINLTSTGAVTAINNYFEGYTTAAKAAINNSSGTNTCNIVAVGNSYFNNTANTAGLGDFPLIFDNGTLASTGFLAAGSQNFTPNQVLFNLGFPGLFENVTAYQGYLDGGALQHLAGAGVPGRTMMVSGQHILAG